MAKKKQNVHFDRDELIDRRAKKRAMRDDHKDQWRFSSKQTYEEDDYDEQKEYAQ